MQQQQEGIPPQSTPQPPALSCFSTFPSRARYSPSYSRDRLQVLLLLLVVLTAPVPGCSVRIKLTLWCQEEFFFQIQLSGTILEAVFPHPS